MKILIVEDTVPLAEAIQSTLEGDGFLCEYAYTYRAAEDKLVSFDYDILVVDINLPDGSGLNLIREAKRVQPDTGIIVISARNSLDNKIEGLELGADDYLTKPFEMAELVARIKSLIRRRHFRGQSVVKHGDIEMDTTHHTVSCRGEILGLTKSEYDILLFFLSNAKRVLTKESIAEHIYGENMDLAESFDFIYSHIKNIRKKIKAAGGEDPIRVVYGIGYRLNQYQ